MQLEEGTKKVFRWNQSKVEKDRNWSNLQRIHIGRNSFSRWAQRPTRRTTSPFNCVTIVEEQRRIKTEFVFVLVLVSVLLPLSTQTANTETAVSSSSHTYVLNHAPNSRATCRQFGLCVSAHEVYGRCKHRAARRAASVGGRTVSPVCHN